MSNFAGGVDSGKTPTRASQADPTGLKLNQVSWAVNCTMRGGGIGCRTGFRKTELEFNSDEGLRAAFEGGLFQGAFMYEPDFNFPYVIASISGRIYAIRTDTDNSVVDITIPGDPNPADQTQVWMCQAETYLVIQDGVSVPLIWDGTTLVRATYVLGSEQVPVGTCMDYYQGRLWVAIGRTYQGSNIVGGGPPGTAPDYRDAVLYFTEVPIVFTVPAQSGNITCLTHAAAIDTALGQGPLVIFTRKKVYAADIPATRALWTTTTELIQRVIQVNFGSPSDRSVVQVNGDLFYRAFDGIRSLWLAVRDFNSWGNLPISRNVNRAIQYEDRALMRFSSGILFDNKLYQSSLPVQSPRGVVFKAALVLDFDLISSLQEREPPAWEGMCNGLNILQLLAGDFGGLERGFALTSGLDENIELWEITTADRFDNDAGRIAWTFESPSFVWTNPYQLKKLESMQLWVDRLWGTVDFEVWFREDQNPCWLPWHAWQDCANRNPCEDPDVTDCYVQQDYREQYRATYTLPQPPDPCVSTSTQYYGSKQPSIGYHFQVMVIVRGYARIRGMLLHALPVEAQPFKDIVC